MHMKHSICFLAPLAWQVSAKLDVYVRHPQDDQLDMTTVSGTQCSVTPSPAGQSIKSASSFATSSGVAVSNTPAPSTGLSTSSTLIDSTQSAASSQTTGNPPGSSLSSSLPASASSLLSTFAGTRIVPKQRSTRSSTVISSSTATPSAVSNDSTLCDHGEMNRTAWNYYDMDYWVAHFADEYPNNFMNNEPVPEDSNFVDYLAILAGNLGNFKCTLEACNIQDAIDIVSLCQNGTRKNDTDLEPITSFMLYNLQNFWDWQNDITKAIYAESQEFSDTMQSLVLEFTTHKISGGSDAAIFTMITGILTILSTMIDPEAAIEMVAISTAAIGFSTTAGGITSDLQSTGLQVIQSELQDVSDLGDILNSTTQSAIDAVQDFAKGVLETVPNSTNSSSGEAWTSLTDSAPGALTGGMFAEPPNDSNYTAMSTGVYKSFAATMISSAMSLDSVFVTKVTKTINSQKPCDMKLDKLDGARQCDGDIAYFLIKAQSASKNLQPYSSWEPVMGLNKLGNYSLDILSLAKASEWYQDKYGAYLVSPTEADLSSAIDNKDGPPGGLWVNLPLVNYDASPDIGRSKVYGQDTNREDIFLSTLSYYIPKLHGWPYSNDFS